MRANDASGAALATLANQTAAPVAAANAYLDLADGIEAGITPRDMYRAVGAKIVGLVSGAGSGTEAFRGIGEVLTDAPRVTVNVDQEGNRTSVVIA